MNKTLIDKLGKIYKSSKDDFIFDYVVPAFFIITYLCIVTIQYIKTNLLESKTSWSSSKCVPKYMFVSGLINKLPQESILGSTYDNFEKCVKSFRIGKSSDTPNRPSTSTTTTTSDTTSTSDDIVNNYNKMLQALKILGILNESRYNDYKSKNIDFITDVHDRFLNEFNMVYTQLNDASVEDIKNMIHLYIKNNYKKILTTYKMLDLINEAQYKEFNDKPVEFMTEVYIRFLTESRMSYTQLNNASVEDVISIVTSLNLH